MHDILGQLLDLGFGLDLRIGAAGERLDSRSENQGIAQAAIGDIPFGRIGEAVGEPWIDDFDGRMNGRDRCQNFINIIGLAASGKISSHRKGDLRLGDAPIRRFGRHEITGNE